MSFLKISSFVILLAAGSAAAQAGPATSVAQLWAGVGLETILPTAQLGFSLPVGRVGGLTVEPRAQVEVSPVLFFGADLLLAQGNVGWYGGPSVGVTANAGGGWRAGGVLGYRGRTREHLGFYAEGGLRYTVLNDFRVGNGGVPGDTGPHRFTFPSPSVRLGLTYRF
ncbi:hypothetical protein [Deinococcus multiflagellatus]|uniref:Outer membrane protein beta-barrel domain-containing protein n=1 Tax=Deinococcus multiflagellatus TaxID=1656887 RepID=A0ABW1ZKC6_9DEIO|nr:hypothetical protein [Deinococcus multiflagellatus]MBZ9714580.1 hypothetical protein [Deinococcus multiflagellatus]